MKNKNPWLNSEGYFDPTAKCAFDKVLHDDRAEKVVKTMKCVADLAGFKVTAPIEIENRKTCKRYRSGT